MYSNCCCWEDATKFEVQGEEIPILQNTHLAGWEA